MAGRDIGWLLLDVIIADKQRTFKLKEGYTHEYKWDRQNGNNGAKKTQEEPGIPTLFVE